MYIANNDIKSNLWIKSSSVQGIIHYKPLVSVSSLYHFCVVCWRFDRYQPRIHVTKILLQSDHWFWAPIIYVTGHKRPIKSHIGNCNRKQIVIATHFMKKFFVQLCQCGLFDPLFALKSVSWSMNSKKGVHLTGAGANGRLCRYRHSAKSRILSPPMDTDIHARFVCLQKGFFYIGISI